jgi:hypothetical protein
MTASSLAGKEGGSSVVDLTEGEVEPTARPTGRAETAYFGAGPEPEGSLELLSGDGSPGSELTFRLPVPAPLAGRGGLARLLVATHRTEDPARVERTGLLLERSAIVGVLEAVAAPAHEEVEITVRLPRGSKVTGTSLSFQGVWSSLELGAERRQLTDAVEVWLQR